MKILIIGAGGHTSVVADILLQAKDSSLNVDLIGFLDDNSSLHGEKILGLPVLGGIELIESISHNAVIIAIGNNETRANIYKKLKEMGEEFTCVIHPSAVISQDVEIGEGTMICGGVVVNSGSTIGANAILNTGCTIDHHNKIEDHVHIAPGVHTGGEVRVGEGTLVGIGSTILPRRSIGKWVIVGGGSLVNKDIPDDVVVFGVPAKIIKVKKE